MTHFIHNKPLFAFNHLLCLPVVPSLTPRETFPSTASLKQRLFWVKVVSCSLTGDWISLELCSCKRLNIIPALISPVQLRGSYISRVLLVAAALPLAGSAVNIPLQQWLTTLAQKKTLLLSLPLPLFYPVWLWVRVFCLHHHVSVWLIVSFFFLSLTLLYRKRKGESIRRNKSTIKWWSSGKRLCIPKGP